MLGHHGLPFDAVVRLCDELDAMHWALKASSRLGVGILSCSQLP